MLDLSCRDWERRLREGRSLVPALQLPNVEMGERAVAAFNMLRLSDVPGTPTLAEAGGPWFTDIVRALFGSLDPVTKTRLIAELFLLVPKKNAKTTCGALLMLVALLLNERPRAPFAMMGPVQDTAEDAFNAVSGAIALDSVLEKKLWVRDHKKTIVHRETKAELEVMTFDPEMLTGKRFAGTLIDELHVIAKNTKAPKSIRQVRGGMVPFPEAFLAFITTQGEEAPSGVFKAELTKARAIRDGVAVGKMLPVLYEFPREMQQDPAQPWKDPKAWPMVTPNLGRSVTIEKLIELYQDAEMKGESEMRGWASQHLNVEIGLALLADGWAGAEYWAASADPAIASLDELLARSEVVVIGIDGGGLDDLLGLGVLGRCKTTKRWLYWARAWAHRIALKRRGEIATKLEDLAAANELVIVEAPGRDVLEVADIVCKVRELGLLPEKAAIGVDPIGIGAIVEELAARGFSADETKGHIVGVQQGFRLHGPVLTTERKLAGGELVHGGQALMAWCAGNAKTETKGNAVYVTKAASGRGKIDPLMALFNCVFLMGFNPQATGDGKPQLFFV